MIPVKGAIYSPKYRITVDGENMNLFDARDLGLIDLHRDPHWGYWEYRVIATGEVVSFQNHFPPNWQKDWSDWYREAITKGPQEIESP